MKTFEGMTGKRLAEIASRFSSLRVAVLGDFFLDKYLDVDASIAETSVETGRTAHQVVAIRHSPGAAGTVVSNLSSLGTGMLHAIGFTGDDGESYDLRADLLRMKVSTGHLHVAPDRSTPTYLKPRYLHVPGLEGEHDRYDTKNRTRTPKALEDAVISSLQALLPELDAVVIADQVDADDCGVVTGAVREALAALAKRFPRTVFWVDSRSHISAFRNVITKPNQFEAAGRPMPKPGETVPMDVLVNAIERLRAATGAPVCTTTAEKGMIVSDPELTAVRAVGVGVEIDTTGAGDSATAGAVLALAAGASLPEAALVGNLVASITIQQLATTGTARPEELLPRLDVWLQQGDALGRGG